MFTIKHRFQNLEIIGEYPLIPYNDIPFFIVPKPPYKKDTREKNIYNSNKSNGLPNEEENTENNSEIDKDLDIVKKGGVFIEKIHNEEETRDEEASEIITYVESIKRKIWIYLPYKVDDSSKNNIIMKINEIIKQEDDEIPSTGIFVSSKTSLSSKNTLEFFKELNINDLDNTRIKKLVRKSNKNGENNAIKRTIDLIYSLYFNDTSPLSLNNSFEEKWNDHTRTSPVFPKLYFYYNNMLKLLSFYEETIDKQINLFKFYPTYPEKPNANELMNVTFVQSTILYFFYYPLLFYELSKDFQKDVKFNPKKIFYSWRFSSQHLFEETKIENSKNDWFLALPSKYLSTWLQPFLFDNYTKQIHEFLSELFVYKFSFYEFKLIIDINNQIKEYTKLSAEINFYNDLYELLKDKIPIIPFETDKDARRYLRILTFTNTARELNENYDTQENIEYTRNEKFYVWYFYHLPSVIVFYNSIILLYNIVMNGISGKKENVIKEDLNAILKQQLDKFENYKQIIELKKILEIEDKYKLIQLENGFRVTNPTSDQFRIVQNITFLDLNSKMNKENWSKFITVIPNRTLIIENIDFIAQKTRIMQYALEQKLYNKIIKEIIQHYKLKTTI